MLWVDFVRPSCATRRHNPNSIYDHHTNHLMSVTLRHAVPSLDPKPTPSETPECSSISCDSYTPKLPRRIIRCYSIAIAVCVFARGVFLCSARCHAHVDHSTISSLGASSKCVLTPYRTFAYECVRTKGREHLRTPFANVVLAKAIYIKTQYQNQSDKYAWWVLSSVTVFAVFQRSLSFHCALKPFDCALLSDRSSSTRTAWRLPTGLCCCCGCGVGCKRCICCCAAQCGQTSPSNATGARVRSMLTMCLSLYYVCIYFSTSRDHKRQLRSPSIKICVTGCV